MKLFKFLDPLFHLLNDGKAIRVTVMWAIRVVGAVLAAVGVLWCIAVVALGFKGSDMAFDARSSEFLIGALLFAVFGLAFAYLTCGVCLYRANSIADLADGHFTALPILSILFRLVGEVACIGYSLIGVGGCFVLWITGLNPLTRFGGFAPDLPFSSQRSGGLIGGLEFAIVMLLLAFGAIVLFYALAEFTVVAVEIANNTRALDVLALCPAEATTSASIGRASTTVVRSTNAENVKGPLRCNSCREPIEAGAAFCAECGLPVSN